MNEVISGTMQEASAQKHERRSGIIVFDTKFGNTEKIAKSIAAGLERAGVEVQCVSVSEAHPEALKDYDLLVAGAPTQAFTASKPMKEFIDHLESVGGLAGKKFFAFDTKLPSRFSGSAAKYIESKLERMGTPTCRTEVVCDRTRECLQVGRWGRKEVRVDWVRAGYESDEIKLSASVTGVRIQTPSVLAETDEFPSFESSYSINLFRTTEAHVMKKSVKSRSAKMSTGNVE